eukprot:Awhi_evm1s2672
MLFSQLLVACVVALSTAAPLSVTVSFTTCGSHFTSLDYECRQAGLIGARDANAVCPSRGCELGFCCKYSIPQVTPPKPQAQVVTVIPPKTWTGRIVRIDSDCQSANRCYVTIKGYNFERDCSISIHKPDNGNSIYHERTKCNREEVQIKLHSDVARKYGELLINIQN